MSAAISGRHLFRDNVSMSRPMGQPPPFMTRPPNPGAAPLVVSASGLGGGGGAGIGANSDSAWGVILVTVGIAPGLSGTLVLQWPVTPLVPLQFFADWASFVVTGTNPYSLAWTASAPLTTRSQPHRLAYQWSVAQ